MAAHVCEGLTMARKCTACARRRAKIKKFFKQLKKGLKK